MNRLRHVLVIEDCDEDFETVLDAAERTGVKNEIRRAISGDECLKLLQESSQNKNTTPALVLLDLNMPKGDGRYALQQIKHDALLRTLPVVVLSTSDNPLDLAFCYTNGANAYHVKPVNHGDHLRVLEQIFGYWLNSVVLSN